jgi:hypothetical protein
MRSILSVTAGLMLALAACEGGPGAEPGSSGETSVQGVAVSMSDAGAKRPTLGRCEVDSDCQIFADYCGGCNCRALPEAAAVIQGCRGPIVACFRDPCGGMKAVCESGACVARPEGAELQ